MGSSLGLAIVVMAIILGAAALWRRYGRGRGSGGRPSRFKCHDCEHLRRTFDDGVMCGYGSREVFKTRAHIRMCPDWTPRRRG